MKKIYIFSLLLALLFIGCKEAADEELPGTIYGVITDKATGEPVQSAGVELSPVGLKTITGTEGQFEFSDLTPGNYTLLVTKAGYADFASNTIVVKPGQTAKGDVQIELLPPALKIVDDNRQEISELDFGSAESDVARSFNIFNDGVETLEYQITQTAIWIDSISRPEGKVLAGNIQPIVVYIDRNNLHEKENTTTIHIISNSGSKQITVTAINNRTSISLNILEATDITASSAMLNAEILNEGNPKYTERGFVYSTEPMPTIDKTISLLTAPVTDDSKFSVRAEGLKLNQTYYARAYATNILGLVYSNNQVSFVANPSLPSVSTQEVTQIDIAAGNATFNGTINTKGDPEYKERGFAYGTVPNPTIEDNKKIVAGTEVGSYSANVKGLEEGNVYYVRAYATNEQGTAYGTNVSFSFIATMPTITTLSVTNIRIGQETVTFNGQIETLGDLGYSERGFVYSTTHNPTIDDTKLLASGSGLGVYSLNATGIQEGSIYYVRAYVQNTKGVVYGNEESFDFNAVLPTLTTQEATNKNIANGMASFNGTIQSVGDPAYTERGFVYGIMHNPTITDGNKIAVSGSGVGAFMANVTGLKEGAIYYIRAYANTPKQCVYGEEVSMDFTATMPVVSTQEVTQVNIAAGTASFNGRVESLGDLGYTERGFVYGLAHNPTKDDSEIKVVSGTEVGSFSVNVTGLSMGKVYYVRAYIENTKGIVYGDEKILDFTPVLPEVVTGTFDFKSSTSVVFNGEITNVGDPAYTERGFVYGTMLIPTLDNGATKVVAVGTIAGVFNAEAAVEIGKVYYMRAYAISPAGVAYGETKEVIEPGLKEYLALPTFQHNGQTYRVYPDLGSKMQWEQAMLACEDLTFGGYDDWILPSKEVLNTMYINKSEIGGFDGQYWSSSESSIGYHWCQSFDTGGQFTTRDDSLQHVRPVRIEE